MLNTMLVKICVRDENHGCIRYRSDGRCVTCIEQKNYKRRNSPDKYTEDLPSLSQIAKTIAAFRGRTKYFTGVPCGNGHICERRLNDNSCIDCGNELRQKQLPIRRVKNRIYKKNNKGIINAGTARRRSKKLQAFPTWAQVGKINDEIKNIYKLCPKGYHVDHILPLQGILISGLHLPWNLQYLKSDENESKHNSFIPYHESKGIRIYLG